MMDSIKLDLQTEAARGAEASIVFARNLVLINWFLSDEKDPALGTFLKEIMEDLASRKGFTTSFAANVRTGNYYDKGSYLNKLTKEDPDDSWFFDSLSAKEEVLLNVDYNAKLKTTNLWFNAQIRYQGSVIGIAGVGISITDVINQFKEAIPSKNSIIFLVDQENHIYVSSLENDEKTRIEDFISGDVKQVKGYDTLSYFVHNNDKYVVSRTQIGTSNYGIMVVMPIKDFVPTFWELNALGRIYFCNYCYSPFTWDLGSS